ncbi:RTA1 like protein-domain-containing protein [Aspergillus pseudoustus]|uniref:RTA1 like protein-domain-containing protein n=1 Tax=Aspergillus pseudoustus TaxID=1810923 RepID=A0ABR4JKU8_9EURO
MSATTTTTTVSATSASATSTETCIPMTPNKVGYVPPEGCGNILMYEASFPAAILFAVLFGLTTLVHIIQAFVYKKRYSWVVIMGSAWELGAFIMRSLFAQHQNNEAYNTVFTILFLLAPIWVNAFLYMTLGRLIYFFLPDGRLGGFSAKRFGHIFVWLEMVAFIVQLAGAGITSSTDAPPKTIMLGVHIYMGGIGLQQFFIFVFTGLFIHLQLRIAELERTGQGRLDVDIPLEKTRRGLISGSAPWRWLFYSIYAALFLISVRIIFRLAQYARGTDVNNPALRYEWFEYVWDAAPMFLALVILNLVHPGRVLRGPDSEFPRLSRREKKQLKREKKEAKRTEREERKQRRFHQKHGSIGMDLLDSQERGVAGDRV